MCLRFVVCLSLGMIFLIFRIFLVFFCFLPLIFTLRDKCVRVLAKLTINLYLIQCFNFCSYFHAFAQHSRARLFFCLFVKFIKFQVLSLARLPLNNFLLVFVVSLTSHSHHRAKRFSFRLSLKRFFLISSAQHAGIRRSRSLSQCKSCLTLISNNKK